MPRVQTGKPTGKHQFRKPCDPADKPLKAGIRTALIALENAIWGRKDLFRKNDHRVARIIASYIAHSPTRAFYAKPKKIAETAKVSEIVVWRQLKAMVAAGVLRKGSRKTKAGRRERYYAYYPAKKGDRLDFEIECRYDLDVDEGMVSLLLWTLRDHNEVSYSDRDILAELGKSEWSRNEVRRARTVLLRLGFEIEIVSGRKPVYRYPLLWAIMRGDLDADAVTRLMQGDIDDAAVYVAIGHHKVSAVTPPHSDKVTLEPERPALDRLHRERLIHRLTAIVAAYKAYKTGIFELPPKNELAEYRDLDLTGREHRDLCNWRNWICAEAFNELLVALHPLIVDGQITPQMMADWVRRLGDWIYQAGDDPSWKCSGVLIEITDALNERRQRGEMIYDPVLIARRYWAAKGYAIEAKPAQGGDAC